MNILVILFLCINLSQLGLSNSENDYYDCGTLERIPGDIRTNAPWIAGIFITSPDSTPKFFTTATIIGPNSVLAIAPGPFGSILRGSGDLPPPETFKVIAGINSTDYNSADAHTQFSEVHFIEPDLTRKETNEQYHYVIYHLKTLLDFKTPYVKAICLLPEENSNDFSPIGWEFVSVGFGADMLRAKTGTLSIAKIQSQSKDVCSTIFRFHYKRELEESNVFCGNKSGTGPQLSTALGSLDSDFSTQGFCFLHGSITTLQIGSKWHIAGLLALIPSRRFGQCDDKSMYFFAELKSKSWMFNSISCSPDKFACDDPQYTCVATTSVCNGIEDCPGGKDEDTLFCEVEDKCNATRNESMHNCGLNGNCILKSQLCDERFDCVDASDEKAEFCNTPNKTNGTHKQTNCPRITLPSGVRAECSGKEDCLLNTGPNSEITITCKAFHTSPYEYSSVTMTCDGAKGVWKNQRPLSCALECGIHPESATTRFPPNPQRNLPWNGYIISVIHMNDSVQVNVKCSTVSIDASFAITSAHCLAMSAASPERWSVAWAPTRTILQNREDFDGVQRSVVDQSWTPSQHYATDIDLTLIKTGSPRTVVGGVGGPVCYLNPAFTRNRGGSNGTLMVVRVVKGTERDKLGVTNFKMVSREDCISHFGDKNVPSYTFCARVSKGKQLSPLDVGTGLYLREKNPITGHFQLYLKGIAINPAFPVSRSNSSEAHQLFTSTGHLTKWIMEIMEQNYDKPFSLFLGK